MPTLPNTIESVDLYSSAIETININGKSKLTNLNANGCHSLKTLICTNCALTSLDVNAVTNEPMILETINVSNNKITGIGDNTLPISLKNLDLSNNPSITEVNCERCALTTLKVSGCSAITKLYCPNNKITSLNLSGLTQLKTVYCPSNQITSLSNFPSGITSLDCSYNSLTI